jgi:galactoside O-acetyltransferase
MLGGGNKHKITLGRWCFIGYGSKLFCASEDYSGDHGPVNEFWNPSNKIYRGDIKFNNYSGIASNCLVMPGVELPEGCTIGAGGFIYSSKPLQPWSVMLGSWENGKYQLKLHKQRNREEVIRYDSQS